MNHFLTAIAAKAFFADHEPGRSADQSLPPAAIKQYLSAAGVGEIGIVDNDIVSLSNLQRQVLFTTEDVGQPKVECAARAMAALNSYVKIIPYNLRINEMNAQDLMRGYDLVADGCDNFATRAPLG